MAEPPISKACIFPDQDDLGTILDVRILEVNPMPSSRCTQSPAMYGLNINDNKVRNPTKVKVRCGLVVDQEKKYKDTLKQIHNMQVSQDTKFSSVLSHVAYYKNLTLLESPHREDVESFDVYEFDLLFQEIIIAGAGPTVSNEEFGTYVALGNVGSSQG